MTEPHPNIALMSRLDLTDLAGDPNLFSPEVVFHYTNPNLPDFEGDYVGPAAIGAFFSKLAEKSRGTFSLEPISITPAGDELVVAHTKNTMALDGETFAIHAVTVWRIVGDRITEVWDIPSAYTLAT